jgi:hypothetical protein
MLTPLTTWHNHLRNWVKQTERPMRRAHLIETAAVNNGIVQTQKRVRPWRSGQTVYKIIDPDIQRLYKDSNLTTYGCLPTAHSGVVQYMPCDDKAGTWFKPIMPSKRRHYSKHKLTSFYNAFRKPYQLPGLPYRWECGDLEVNSSKWLQLPEKLKQRAKHIETLADKTVGAISIIPPTAEIFSGVLQHWPIADVFTKSVIAGAISVLPALGAKHLLPSLYTSLRTHAERTGFTVAKAVAFPRQTLSNILQSFRR